MNWHKAIGRINSDIIGVSAARQAVIARAKAAAASGQHPGQSLHTGATPVIPNMTGAQALAAYKAAQSGQSSTTAQTTINPLTGQPYPPGINSLINPMTGQPYPPGMGPGSINPMTGMPYLPGAINPMTGMPFPPGFSGGYGGGGYSPGYFPSPSEQSYGAAYNAPTSADFGLSAAPDFGPSGSGGGGGGFDSSGGLSDDDSTALQSYMDPTSQIGYWNT
jgi:hypothetical protein